MSICSKTLKIAIEYFDCSSPILVLVLLCLFFSHCTKVFDRNLCSHQSVFIWYFKSVDKMEFDIFFLVELISLFCHKELLMDDKTKKELKVTKVPYFYDDD